MRRSIVDQAAGPAGGRADRGSFAAACQGSDCRARTRGSRYNRCGFFARSPSHDDAPSGDSSSPPPLYSSNGIDGGRRSDGGLLNQYGRHRLGHIIGPFGNGDHRQQANRCEGIPQSHMILSPCASQQFVIQIYNLLNQRAFADFVAGVLQNDRVCARQIARSGEMCVPQRERKT
jgi:hypothetical protein